MPAITRFNLPLKISASVAALYLELDLTCSVARLRYRLFPGITILQATRMFMSASHRLDRVDGDNLICQGTVSTTLGGRLTSIQCSNVQLISSATAILISGPTGNPGQQLTIRTTTSLALPTVSNVNQTTAPAFLVLFSLGPHLNVSTFNSPGTLNSPFPEKPSLLTLPYPR